jgi:hypothetical protein
MGQCIKCGKKVGFFSTKDMGLVSPLCSNCAKELEMELLPLIEILLKSDVQSLEREPKTMGTIAALHLLCAERVNIVHQLKSDNTGQLEDHHTWGLSRIASMKFCLKALEKINNNPDANIFLHEVMSRAESLKTCEAPVLVASRFLKLPGSLTRPEHQAICSGVVTIKDFEEFLKSIPGNQWLKE